MRQLHPGEDFVLSVSANTGPAALKEWFAPIYYDASALTYVSLARAPLWLNLIETDEVPTNANVHEVTGCDSVSAVKRCHAPDAYGVCLAVALLQLPWAQLPGPRGRGSGDSAPGAVDSTCGCCFSGQCGRAARADQGGDSYRRGGRRPADDIRHFAWSYHQQAEDCPGRAVLPAGQPR